MIVDNGRRGILVIEGVFDGVAGVQADELAFVCARAVRVTPSSKAWLDGRPIKLAMHRDARAPYCVATFAYID